jgi:hypothetical protein
MNCTVLRPLRCLQNTDGLVDCIPHWVENSVLIFDAGHLLLAFRPHEAKGNY